MNDNKKATQQTSMRPFFLIWTCQALSLLGSQAVQFALIWWLTQETGSATMLATATLLGLLPQVVLGPLAGAIVDRCDRKQVMLAADGLVALASLVLAGLFFLGAVRYEYVLTILFVRALGSTFHGPAMQASTTLMVPEEHLTRIQGINQSLQGGLLIVSAPLGGLLLALLDMSSILLVDVVTAMIAMVPLLFITVPQPKLSSSDYRQEKKSLMTDVLAGFRYLAVRPGHLGIVIMAAVTNLFMVPAFALLPLFVLQELQGGPMQLGWMTSSFGVGALAGGILLGIWGGFNRRILTTLVGLIALGIVVLALGLAPPGKLWWALTAMLGVGTLIPLVNGPIQAVLQATTAPEFQGRIFTLVASLAGITAPLGLIGAAPIAELFGVRVFYLAGALACVLMGLGALSAPAITRIEEQRPTPTP
jgi:DHA3 family macrolide efflux protein-like MFS transporter